MGNKTIERHRKVITIKSKVMITFEKSERVIKFNAYMEGGAGVAVKVLFFDLNGIYKGVSLMIIKLHITFMWISIFVFSFTIKRCKGNEFKLILVFK